MLALGTLINLACHDVPAQKEFVVHREHEDAFVRFNERVLRSGRLFLTAIGVCLFVILQAQ